MAILFFFTNVLLHRERITWKEDTTIYKTPDWTMAISVAGPGLDKKRRKKAWQSVVEMVGLSVDARNDTSAA